MKLLPVVLKHFKTKIAGEGRSFYVLPKKILYASYGVYYECEMPAFQPTQPLAFDGEIFLKVYKDRSDVALDDEQLVVDGKFKLRPIDANPIEEKEFVLAKGTALEIPESFVDDLKHVLFAVGNDQAAVTFNYVLFDIEDGELTMVGTDGFRMSVVRRKSGLSGTSFMLQRDQVRALLDILKRIGTEDAVLYRDGEYLVVATEQEKVAFKVAAPNFPDYKGLLKRIKKENAFLITDEFREAVKRIKDIAKEHALRLVVENGKVSLVHETVEIVYEEVVSELVVGEFEDYVLFNPVYLHEVLVSQKGGGKVWFADSVSPFVFEFEDSPEYFHVLMPIRKNAY